MRTRARFSRRQILHLTGLTAASGLLAACSPYTRSWDKERAPVAGPTPTLRGPAVIRGGPALQRLMNGNLRYVANYAQAPGHHPERRAQVAERQHPFAAILCCADSRVPPEIVFDQGLGDLFVVRVAGNVADDEIVGSLEYAVEHLGVKLIMVLGHERCGAVRAALENTVAGGHAEGQMGHLLHSLEPAIEAADVTRGNVWDVVINTNALLTAATLMHSPPILAEFVEHGELQVVAARYDLDTGLVKLLTDNHGDDAAAAEQTNEHGSGDPHGTPEAHATPEPQHSSDANSTATPTAMIDHSGSGGGGHSP
jgi:carbonic anhydrase